MFQLRSASIALLVVLSGCGGSSETQSSTYLSCTAAATATSASPVSITLYGTGGTAPYHVTSVRLGTSLASGVTGTTSFSSTTQISGTFDASLDYTNNSGTVMITDSSETPLSGTCPYTLGTGTTGTPTAGTGGLTCTVGLSSSPSTAGNYITATATVASNTSAWLDSISFGSAGTVTGYYTSSTTAQLYFQTAGTYLVQMLVKDSTGKWGTCSKSHVVY